MHFSSHLNPNFAVPSAPPYPEAMKTVLRMSLLIAVPSAVACTAMQLRERFTPQQGQVAAIRAEGRDAGTEKAEVAMFYDKAPEGFALVGGEAVVQTGYPHVVLGRIDLMPDDGDCHRDVENLLDRSKIFERMRDRAYREGGNAVIFIRTASLTDGMSDCERLRKRMQDGYPAGPWATGFVVRLVDEPKLEGLTDLDDEDGGVSDAGMDAQVLEGVHPDEVPAPPEEVPAPSLELPPPPPQ